jgi:hypothetical protein
MKTAQLSSAVSWHTGLTMVGIYYSENAFQTLYKPWITIFLCGLFYTGNCFCKKSTFILHFYRNYIFGVVYILNIRQYVSSIVIKGIKSQAIS